MEEFDAVAVIPAEAGRTAPDASSANSVAEAAVQVLNGT